MIELWGGVNAPWFPWLLPGQGEYAFVGSGLAAIVSGGQALAVSFWDSWLEETQPRKASAFASHLGSYREVKGRGIPARSPIDRKFP